MDLERQSTQARRGQAAEKQNPFPSIGEWNPTCTPPPTHADRVTQRRGAGRHHHSCGWELERQRHRETDMEEEPERDGHRRDTGERERQNQTERYIERARYTETQRRARQRRLAGARRGQMCAHSQARASVEQPLSVVLPGGAQPALEGRGGVWWVAWVLGGKAGGGASQRALSLGTKVDKVTFGVAARVRLEVGPQAWGGDWVNLFSLGLGLGLGGLGLSLSHLPPIPSSPFLEDVSALSSHMLCPLPGRGDPLSWLRLVAPGYPSCVPSILRSEWWCLGLLLLIDLGLVHRRDGGPSHSLLCGRPGGRAEGGGAERPAQAGGVFPLAMPGAASAQLVGDSPLLCGTLLFGAVNIRLSWGWGVGGCRLRVFPLCSSRKHPGARRGPHSPLAAVPARTLVSTEGPRPFHLPNGHPPQSW